MIKAVLFDLDGTIADTIPAIAEGINIVMRKRGYPEHPDEAVLGFINYGSRELMRSAMPEELRTDEELVSAVLADYDEAYGTCYDHTTETYPGIPELIRTLRDDLGLKIGILSNKQDIYVKQLSAQLLPDKPYGTAQGVIPGKPTKPDPFLSNCAASALGVDTNECIMIGDSHIDFYTAQNAGMTHIGVSWGYRNEEFLRSIGATHIAHTADELLSIIKTLL